MTLLQRLLLIPSLVPLVAVLVLSALHRGAPTRLHLLGWSSPQAPLGLWTALAATSAAALSASSALLIVPRNQPLRRRLHRPYEAPSAPEWVVDGARAPQDRSTVPSRRKETCVIQLQRWPLLIASSNVGFHTRTSTILKVKEQINRSESLSHLEFPIPNLNSPRRTWGRIGEMIPIAIGSPRLDLRTVTPEILIR